MNWVDLIIIIALAFFTYEGLNRQFVPELLDLLSFVLAYFFSLRFYDLASKFLEKSFSLPRSLSNILGFILIWFLVEGVLFSAVRYLLSRQSPQIRYIHILNRLSPILSFLRGLIFISILLLILGNLPIQPRVKHAVDDSKIGSFILRQAESLEAPFKTVFGGLSQDTLTFLTVKPQSGESVNIGFKTSDFKVREDLELQMVDLVNQERVKQSLDKLTFDPKLRGIAREHSGDMFTRGYFSHYSPEGKSVADRANIAGIPYLVIGENLAFAPTLELAHRGLMNSPGHRANILSADYHKIGIGIMESRDYGLMITQVFSN